MGSKVYFAESTGDRTLSTEDAKSDGIQAAFSGRTVVLRVVGRGSFKTAPSMKAFVHEQFPEDAGGHVVFDMRDCVSMDSTFMGVLAGLAVRLKKSAGGRVSVVHLTPKTFSLLETLGVCRLLDAYETESTPPELAQIVDAVAGFSDLKEAVNHLSNVETMLDAHEELVRASPDNRERFQDVISYLSKDVEDLKASED